MNIIERVKDVLNNYSGISAFSNDVHIDYTDSEPTNFGISSSGDMLIKKDILGNQTRQHNFVLYAINQSFNDFDRLQNSTFLLDLNYFLETVKGQEVEATVNGVVETGKIKRMWSANGMIYDIPDGNLDAVTYQLQIYAEYTLKESEE